MRIRAGLACLLFLAVAMRAESGLLPSSFKAFYCAGKSLLNRASPYAIEPLKSCERQLAPGVLPSFAVEPAPLPGYALAPWLILATLPPAGAAVVFIALMLAALLATSWAIGKMTQIDPPIVAAALAAVWFLNASLGELPPVATACIAFSALMLERRRPWPAALGAAGVAVQPHLAAPLWIALFLFYKPARLPLLTIGIGLIVIDVAIGGPLAALHYFTQTLPGQALSEVDATDQYSLTHALAVAGVGASDALRVGLLSYAVMAAAGIAVARRLADRGQPEFLALAPPAFVLAGGTFVHDIQFLAALPLAFVLLARAKPNLAVTSATLLLVPSWNAGLSRLSIALSAVSVFAVMWIVGSSRAWRAALGGAAAVAIVILIVVLNGLPAPPRIHPSSPAIALRAGDQSSIAWSAYIHSVPALSVSSARSVLGKVPTWTGIVLLVGFTLSYARRPAH